MLEFPLTMPAPAPPAPTTGTYAPNTAPKAQALRKWVQLSFLALNMWIGMLFVRFVAQLEQGVIPTVSRPPGLEGYLPIGALVSLKHWAKNGEFSMVHPAGLVLLLTFIAIAVLLKKGFCSWLCPVGLLSEYLERLRRLLIKRPFSIPPWLDFPLRGVKYFLLLFFIWAILIQMNAGQLAAFVNSDYNKVADVKMLRFFTDISPFALGMLIALTILSVLIPYFWCRFLCPYGALLGFLSIFSPVSVRRNAASCIDCRACTKACPALITVHRMAQVSSDECHACYQCVDACPVADTLSLRLTGTRRSIPPWSYAALLVGLFLAATGTAQLLGCWKSQTTAQEYLELMPRLDSLSHIGTTAD